MNSQTAFDRTALCLDIRSHSIYGTGAYHHWCVDIPDQVQMQSISCAKCGNYQLVSSPTLHTALMLSAPTILCQDEEHIRVTNETIFAEEGGLEDLEEEDLEEDDLEEDYDYEEPPIMRYSEQFEVRNERLDDWSEDEEENYDWASDNYFPGN